MLKAIFMGFVFFIATVCMERFYANRKVNYRQWLIAAIVYTIVYWLISFIW